MLLYNSILKINKKYYLPCWILYMDLIETRNNPENIDFYNWDSIIIDNCYKNNLNNNIYNIIEIVKENVIKITNNTKNYYIENDEVVLDFGLLCCRDCHHFIDTFGYCNC
jgi:hypothetical protein